MWNYKAEKIGAEAVKLSISSHGKGLSFEDVFTLWSTSDTFNGFYNQMLVDEGEGGFFWEHPCVNYESKDAAYEVVLIHRASLKQLTPERDAFENYFEDDEMVVSFPNLGKDAILIVPCPVSDDLDTYTHLGNFVGMGDAQQQKLFWKKVGEECLKKIGATNFWLNTAGLGVYWLHVRLDRVPKYYKHAAYKRP